MVPDTFLVRDEGKRFLTPFLAGEDYLDGEAGAGVAGGDLAVVNRDGAAGDGQAETDAAALAAPVTLNAEEWLEDRGQRAGGDARAEVSYHDS